MNKNVILASGSVYRRTQLQQLHLAFTCTPVDIDESIQAGETARDAALRLSIAKASAAVEAGQQALIIGSDQTAALDGNILGKPGTMDHAVKQLSACSDRQVTFYSGLCVLNAFSGISQHACIVTSVKFRKLTNQQIRNYLNREQPLDCAGSFKCEGLGIALFESITSDDPSALVGLPLISLTKMLLAFGVDVLNP